MRRMTLQPESGRRVKVDAIRQVGICERRSTSASTEIVEILLSEQQRQVRGDLAQPGPVVCTQCGDPVTAGVERSLVAGSALCIHAAAIGSEQVQPVRPGCQVHGLAAARPDGRLGAHLQH